MILTLLISVIPIVLLDLPIIEITKGGEIELKRQSVAVLDLEGYKKGDEIYLEMIFEFLVMPADDQAFLKSLTLDVWEYDKLGFLEDTQQYIQEYKYLKDGLCDYYIYYTIKLKSNYKFLFIKTPMHPYEQYSDMPELDALRPVVHLKHNKHNYDYVNPIFIILVIVFILICFAPVIYLYYRCMKRRTYNPTPQYNNIALNSQN